MLKKSNLQKIQITIVLIQNYSEIVLKKTHYFVK